MESRRRRCTCGGYSAPTSEQDLATARANGTTWDLSLEDDKAELRRVQNRKQPELLVGSPPSNEFSSLLNTCAEAREVSNLRTEKILPQIRACVQSCKLQMECENTSFMNIPKFPVLGRCLRFNPSSMTLECTASMARCVAGVRELED